LRGIQAKDTRLKVWLETEDPNDATTLGKEETGARGGTNKSWLAGLILMKRRGGLPMKERGEAR